MICHCQPAPGCGPCTCPRRCARCAHDWIRALAECCHVAGELHAVRDAGFTEAALAFPRCQFTLRLLTAFNGAPANWKAPRGWHYFPSEESKAAWHRVALAAISGGDPRALFYAWAPSMRGNDPPKPWERVHIAALEFLKGADAA